MAGSIHIGTSGWHYGHWKGPYYPPTLPSGQMLDWYARDFDTVELNNTFYRLPDESAVRAWRANSPPGFQFAAKGSRYLTHMKKLKDPAPGLARFFQRIELLGEKLGPILFQLPPRFERNVARLEEFLTALPGEYRYAFEFRDESWQDAEIYRVLRRFNAAWCIYDLAGFQSSMDITADFSYIRLHGPGNKYQGSYRCEDLEHWIRRIESWDLPATWVYFDNDQAGYAVENAREMKKIAGQVHTAAYAKI